MMNLPAGDFIVADLEYTSWEGAHARNWGGPGEFREIVQIGAVRVSRDGGLKETAAFMALVQPTLNPVLSDYLIDLTGITNADIARAGVPIPEGLDSFQNLLERCRSLPMDATMWSSWKNAPRKTSTIRWRIVRGTTSIRRSARSENVSL
jgi:inhibitor of KinA sporulation pathway (predicted exonuclease)